MIKTTCNYLTGIIIKRGSRVVSPKFLGLQAVCQSRLARLGVSNDAAFQTGGFEDLVLGGRAPSVHDNLHALHIIGTISMCMCPCQGTIFCFNSEGQVYDQEVRRSLYPVVCNVSALITRKIDTLYLYSVYIGEVTKDCVKILVYE